MATIGTQGAIDVSASIVGHWSDVNFATPNDPWDGFFDKYHIGNVEEGVLELTREDYIHIGTALPRVADFLVPIRAGMRFTGQATEVHRALLHALIGDALSSSSQYIYPGVQGCNQFFTLQAFRLRSCDQQVLETRIFKVHAGGLISLGSGDEAVMIPFELEGLDDQANTMKQGGSSSAPLGFFHVPVEGSNVSQVNVVMDQ